MKRLPVLLLVLSSAAFQGCSDNAAGLTGSDPVLVSLSLTPGGDLIRLHTNYLFRLTAHYDTALTKDVTAEAGWWSDTPVVVSVDANGLVRGLSAGWATLFAEYQGLRVERRLRVLADYGGVWQGDWVVTDCREDGDWLGSCAILDTGGAPWATQRLTLLVSQFIEGVSGKVDFGDDLPGALTGVIGDDGTLSLDGTYTVEIEGFHVEIAVTEWQAASLHEMMTGQFCVTLRDPNLTGSVAVDGHLNVVHRTSSESHWPLLPLTSGMIRSVIHR